MLTLGHAGGDYGAVVVLIVAEMVSETEGETFDAAGGGSNRLTSAG
jgi:hypothetical protein